jgi:hypothetical protein
MRQNEHLHNSTIENGTMSPVEEIKMENSPKNNIESLIERGSDYLETRLELMKLQAVNKASETTSGLITTVAVMSIFTLCFLILNIGIALLLGELLGKSYYGFFALSGFYLVTGLILYAMRDKLIKEPVANNMIRKFLK